MKGIFNKETKVAQLSGFVSDEMAYHHGEVSLQGAIIGMAHDFVGTNNINLLLPNGNFGDRLQGGKNHASARYIFTQLNELVPYIFKKQDNYILDYVYDDGTKAEPITYAPIICMELINGSEGIGTGFSTNIPKFNPLDVIGNIRRLIKGQPYKKMKPFYQGFKGEIEEIIKKDGSINYVTHGIFKSINEETIVISELPIGCWTETYKEFLDTLVIDNPKKPEEKEIITSYVSNYGIDTVEFIVHLADGVLQTLLKSGELEKKFKLTSNLSLSNMHLYNSNGSIKKYGTIKEILEEFYEYRLGIYKLRKEHYLQVLKNDMELIGWKLQFINDYDDGKIILVDKINGKNKPRTEKNVIEQVEKLGYPRLHSDPFVEESKKSYDYLTSIKLLDLTEERKKNLEDIYTKKLNEYNEYKELTIQTIWLKELDELEEKYNVWTKEKAKRESDNKKSKITTKNTRRRK